MFDSVRQHAAPSWWPHLGAAQPLFSDPRWLELFAESRGDSGTWWFAAGRGTEAEVGLRGTVVGAGTRKSMNPYRWLFDRTGYHDREPFDAASAPDRSAWFPALLCSYPGLDTYPVGAGDEPEPVRLLLSGIAGWAASRGIATVVVGFVHPEHTAVAVAAAAAGYIAVPVATRANLLVPADGGVFASYSTRQRNNVRRLRARLAAGGVAVAERSDPTEHLDTLVELRCAHARQHGKEPDPAEERAWLGPLLHRIGDRVTVFGATRHTTGELRGFSLFVDDGRWWNAFAVARRDPVADRDVYFELMFHTPAEWAAARGIAEISFGFGTGEAKRRRGCALVPVPAYYLGLDPSVAQWLGERPG